MIKDREQIIWPEEEGKKPRKAIVWPSEEKNGPRRSRRQEIHWPDDEKEDGEGVGIVERATDLVSSLFREPTPVRWPDEPVREKRQLGKKAAKLAEKGAVATAKFAAKSVGVGIGVIAGALVNGKERRQKRVDEVEVQNASEGGVGNQNEMLPAIERDTIVVDIEAHELSEMGMVLDRRRSRIAGALGKDSGQIVSVGRSIIKSEGENG